MTEQVHWDWRRRSIGAVVWPSFLVAAVATMVFFAVVDPLRLLAALEYSADVDHTAVYSVGFFFFWAVALVSSAVTTWLIRTERPRAQYPHD